MKEIALVCGCIFPFVYLFLVMDRLDRYLYVHHHEKADSSQKQELRIAFENLEAGSAVANFLDDFSKKHANYNIKLYYNERKTVLSSLRNKKLDIGFLVGEAARYEDGVFCKERMRFDKPNLLPQNARLPFDPMTEEPIRLNIFLRMNEQNPRILLFMNEFSRFYQNRFVKQETLSCEGNGDAA